MIRLNLILENDEIKTWSESEGINISTVLTILKKNLGYKNQDEVIKDIGQVPSFLRVKLCWRTEQEYSHITQVLNGIVSYFRKKKTAHTCYHLLHAINRNGVLRYIIDSDIDEEKPLIYWTLENTIMRWIKEKF